MARIGSISRVAALLLLIGGSSRALGEPQAPSGTTAMVVLIGEANRTPELAVVLAELLLQQGVQAQFSTKPRFEASALLDAGDADSRVWVFIAPDGVSRVRLYFRGPRGERFLLRELALRAGLDEVGRELIGRVVETSTLALLRSDEGISRAEAQAGIAQEREIDSGIAGNVNDAELAREREQEAAREREREAESEPRDESRPRADDGYVHHVPAERWLLGARAIGDWTGSALHGRYGAGVEVGRVLSRASWPRVRLRAALELNLAQTLNSAAVDARVSTWPLRAGIDVGVARGVQAWLLGLSTGIDFVRTTAEHARDASLALAGASTQFLPASRAELRYELVLSPLLLSAAALVELPWASTHYDVTEDGKRMHLGTPWRVRPGFVLGCGARF